MIDRRPMLRGWLDIVNDNFANYDNIVTDSQERCLIDFYETDETHRDKSTVKAILYRRALYDTRRYDQYFAFLEKENEIDKTTKAIYEKVYSKYMYERHYLAHNAAGQAEEEKKFKAVEKIPVSLSPELFAEKEPLGKYSPMLAGYEGKWKEKKTAKLRDKAYRLRIRNKLQKSIDMLLKSYNVYGDVESAQDLGNIYKNELGDTETALKYYKTAMDNGFKPSYDTYYSIVYDAKYEDNIKLADSSKELKDKIKYLLEAYKYVQKPEDELRMAKILLEPKKSYSDPELGKQLLYSCFNNADITEFGVFALFYAELALEGDVIEGNKLLAYLCNDSQGVWGYGNIAKAKYQDMELLLMKIADKVMETLEAPVAIPMQNIFELGDDARDFDLLPRSKESSENFRKRKDYFAKAMESTEEKAIVDNLKKAGRLGHAKAMVALYNYYLKAGDVGNAYYWIFEAHHIIEKEPFTKELMKTVPVDIPKLLSCLNKHDQYYCLRFIKEHIDLSKKLDADTLKRLASYATRGSETFKLMLYEYYSKFDVVKSIDLLDELKNSEEYGYISAVKYDIKTNERLDDKVLERLEYHANRGNKVFQKKLAEYYSKFDGENELDNLYLLANKNEPKYIHKLIDKKGGFNPRFDERYVSFLDQYALRSNKYAMYISALLHSDKQLCRKFNITYSEEIVFNFLLAAMEADDYGIVGLNNKVIQWIAKCYEYGIGTAVDIKKAAELFSREDGKDVEFFTFAKYCLPEIEKFSNFHNIKEYFLSKIKPDVYERIFEEVKRFLSADFTLSDIFAEDGKYLGGQMKSKLIEREREKERERIRLEEERKERERKERERKELERKERERQEKLRIEEARRNAAEAEARLAAAKQAAVKQSSTTRQTSASSSPAGSSTTPAKAQASPLKAPRYYTKVAADNKYYLELVSDDFNNGIKDEMRAIAGLRECYSYPPPPVYPAEFGMSKRKADKLYAEKLAARKGEILKYADRIFDIENPFGKYGYDNYRRKVWGYASDTVFFTGQGFADYVAKEFNKVSKIGNIEIKATSYKYKDRIGKISDEVYLVERMLAHTPIFADEITFNVKVHFVFHPSYSSDYFDLTQQMSDYADRNHFSDSQRAGFQEYMGNVIDRALSNDVNSPGEQRARAKINAERAIKEYINNKLRGNIVFAGKHVNVGGKKQYIEGVVQKIKTSVTFYSQD